MPENPDKEALIQMVNGYMVSQALRCVGELGIADKLASGRKTIAEISEPGVIPDALYRVMRALCSIGVFRESDTGFENTALSDLLRKDGADSVWSAAVMMPNEFGLAFNLLPEAVRTGENMFQRANGAPGWEYMVQNPQRGHIFDQLMQALHGHETEALVDTYDFSAAELIVDVGGGNGDVLRAILESHEDVKGLLFDRPDVVERTRRSLEGHTIEPRCRFAGGDFFESVPAAGDIYILRHIIHDWTDDEAISILRSCRTAMPDSAKLLIVEGVIGPGNTPSPFKWLDLVMMLCWGGMERTEKQYSRLVREAGLRLGRVMPTSTPVGVLECLPD